VRCRRGLQVDTTAYFSLVTDRVSTGGNAIAPSVCLSVCLFPLYLSNRLTLALIFCMCVGHYDGSQGIETESHRSWSRRGRSDLDAGSRTVSQVIWHDASCSQWQEYALEIGEILHIFPSGIQNMTDRGSKKAYTGPRTGDQIWLLSINRGRLCRSRNDRQTSRQTNRME